MARGFQFSQGEPARIHSSHFPGLRCVGRLCSFQLSCVTPIFILLFTQNCDADAGCHLVEQASVLAAHVPWYRPYRPICFPLNGAQIYLPVTAYSCLHYKYFCNPPLITPQLHLPHGNCQLVVIYRCYGSICRSGCGTGSSHAKGWDTNTTYSYFLILFFLALENKN